MPTHRVRLADPRPPAGSRPRIGGRLTLRSNWNVYCEEFLAATKAVVAHQLVPYIETEMLAVPFSLSILTSAILISVFLGSAICIVSAHLALRDEVPSSGCPLVRTHTAAGS